MFINKKGFSIAEILIASGLLGGLLGLFLFLHLSSAKNKNEEEMKIEFTSKSTTLLEFLKKDLRSASRAEYGGERLMIFSRKLNENGFPEESGIQYRWNLKEVFRLSENEAEQNFLFIRPNQTRILRLLMEKNGEQNLQITIQVLDQEKRILYRREQLIDVPGIKLL